MFKCYGKMAEDKRSTIFSKIFYMMQLPPVDGMQGLEEMNRVLKSRKFRIKGH